MCNCQVFGGKDSAKKIQQSDVELVGDWKTDCFALDVFGFASATSEYDFNVVADFENRYTIFLDDKCDKPSVSQVTRGTYASLENASVTRDEDLDAKNVNFTIDEAYLTPLSDSAAEKLNAVGYCGIDTWQKDKELVIIDRECLGNDINKGAVIFDIYDVQDKSLLLGKSSLLLSKSKIDNRPKELDRNITYTKK